MTTGETRAAQLYGKTVYSTDGEKLGKVDDVLGDDQGQPQYAVVESGWFNKQRHVVPLQDVDWSGDEISVPYTKDQLHDAPTYDPDAEFDYDREVETGRYYGTDVSDWDDDRDALAGEDLSRGPTPETRHPHGGLDDIRDTTEGPTPEARLADRESEPGGGAASGQEGALTGGPMAAERTRGTRSEGVAGSQDWDVDRPAAGGDVERAGRTAGDAAVTRSEEELDVQRRRQQAGRVRLRKWVETEHVQTSVPVEHEEVRVVREDISGGGPASIEGDHTIEVDLEEEVVDVQKQAVGKERIALDKQRVTEDRTVEADLQRERVDVEREGDVEER